MEKELGNILSQREQIIKFLYRVIKPVITVLNYAGMVALAAMMFLTAVDVTLRKLANMPIMGSYEMINFMLLTCGAFGLAYCAIEKRHIITDVVLPHLPKRVQTILGFITGLIGLAVVILVTWQEFDYMNIIIKSNQMSAVLIIPLYPFVGILALGLALYCIVLVIQFFEFVSETIDT